MTKLMYDGTGNDAADIHREFPTANLIAIYLTGSGGIKWTDADKALFPGATFVTIDQGGLGSSVVDAIVRDVEPGAWNAHDAVHTTPWIAARRTIYCDRTDLSSVIAEGWRGDVWLAWPGYSGQAAPVIPGVNVVAVQTTFASDHDVSVVYDDSWPLLSPPPPPQAVLTVTVTGRIANVKFPVAPGADHYVVQYLSTSLAVPVLITRAPQPASGAMIELNDLDLPGSNLGEISVFAIVKGHPYSIGFVTLP